MGNGHVLHAYTVIYLIVLDQKRAASTGPDLLDSASFPYKTQDNLPGDLIELMLLNPATCSALTEADLATDVKSL